MNFNKFTLKAQETVQQAVELARQSGRQAIEPEHLLKSIITNGENVVNFIFQKAGVNTRTLTQALDRQLQSLPKVEGGEPYLSRDTSAVLDKAMNLLGEQQDQYVSIETLLLALLQTPCTAANLLKDAGLTEKDLRAAIAELRGGSRVTSQTSEESYQSLEKYAVNLNEAARSGKLDPVIGRDEEIRRGQ